MILLRLLILFRCALEVTSSTTGAVVFLLISVIMKRSSVELEDLKRKAKKMCEQIKLL